MNVDQVIAQLQAQYPGKTIIQNPSQNPTEIICEIEPAADHADYSVAISVIDKSKPHHHDITEETYEVIKGRLVLFTDDQSHTLFPGDSYTIKPGIHHYATGDETWTKTTARPGWTPKDHLLANVIPKKIVHALSQNPATKTRGLGQEIWQNADLDSYIDTLRNEWKPR